MQSKHRRPHPYFLIAALLHRMVATPDAYIHISPPHSHMTEITNIVGYCSAGRRRIKILSRNETKGEKHTLCVSHLHHAKKEQRWYCKPYDCPPAMPPLPKPSSTKPQRQKMIRSYMPEWPTWNHTRPYYLTYGFRKWRRIKVKTTTVHAAAFISPKRR